MNLYIYHYLKRKYFKSYYNVNLFVWSYHGYFEKYFFLNLHMKQTSMLIPFLDCAIQNRCSVVGFFYIYIVCYMQVYVLNIAKLYFQGK